MVRLSIIIPAFNAASIIERALISICQQTIEDWEVIIVDDASTDNTATIVSAWSARDDRFCLIKLPKNAGPAHARNVGFSHATGEWIALLDADDEWLPERAERLLLADEVPKSDIIADRLVLYSAAANKDRSVSWPWLQKATQIKPIHLLWWDLPGRQAPIGWAKPMFRREWLSRQQLQYRTDLRYAEDWCLLVDSLMQGAVMHILPYAGYRYTLRETEKSFSQTTVNYDALYQLNHYVRHLYSAQWPLVCVLLLWFRGWLIGGLTQKIVLKEAYRQQKWFHLIFLLLTSPRCLVMFIIRYLERL